VREWQDLVGQLTPAAKQLDLKHEPRPGGAIDVHEPTRRPVVARRAKDVRGREYLGARGARSRSSGSSLARRVADVDDVAELIETSRLWGYRREIEPEGSSARRASRQRRTATRTGGPARVGRRDRARDLYGSDRRDRKGGVRKIDPVVARELFIRSALVEGDWERSNAFFHENSELLEEVGGARGARPAAATSSSTTTRCSTSTTSGSRPTSSPAPHFDNGWKEVDPATLVFPRSLLVTDAAESRPRGLAVGVAPGRSGAAASYAFEPGASTTRGTVHVPHDGAHRAATDGFEWSCSGLPLELVETLAAVAAQGRAARRLVPMPDVAAELMR